MNKKSIDWDRDYTAGRWDGFDDLHQWTRYAVVGGIIRQSGAKSVLDVGCGHGLLRNFLPQHAAQSYTGLDISKAALDAVPDPQPEERFICTDIEDWEPEGTYDAIVLSEVLYYLDDIEAVLMKMSGCLHTRGVIIASIYRHPSFFNPDHVALKKTRRFFGSKGYEPVADLQIVTNAPVKNTWSILASRVVR
jgi:2-polyprenyl-3-methyl-5-hydroxy-6-metoxy-1,4-benzoquinol methylase